MQVHLIITVWQRCSQLCRASNVGKVHSCRDEGRGGEGVTASCPTVIPDPCRSNCSSTKLPLDFCVDSLDVPSWQRM